MEDIENQEIAPKPKLPRHVSAEAALDRRRVSPGHFVAALLSAEFLLWLATRLRWFGFDRNEGCVSLLSCAVFCGAVLILALWFLAALRWHVRFQFSIRSLLLLAVAASISCGWLAAERNRATQQREAVRSIRGKSGGKLEVGWDRERWAPAWLCDVLGEKLLGSVAEISFSSDNHAAAPDLQPLRRLTHVRTLFLYDTDLTDAGLEPVQNLKELKELSLVACPRLTDAGLEHIKELIELRQLALINSPITDAGLRWISGLVCLEKLLLGRTQISDDGLQHISRMTHLDELSLARTRVTNAGLQRISGLVRLGKLCLNGTDITDAGLEYLKDMKQLAVLELRDTHVSDEGLTCLEGLPMLQFLDVRGTQVTSKGVREFESALPICEVTSDVFGSIRDSQEHKKLP